MDICWHNVCLGEVGATLPSSSHLGHKMKYCQPERHIKAAEARQYRYLGMHGRNVVAPKRDLSLTSPNSEAPLCFLSQAIGYNVLLAKALADCILRECPFLGDARVQYRFKRRSVKARNQELRFLEHRAAQTDCRRQSSHIQRVPSSAQDKSSFRSCACSRPEAKFPTVTLNL